MDLELYQENILELYKHPQNKKKMKNFTNTARDLNPLCGDEITIFLVVENDVVKEISFDGDGCAISQAAASLLTEKVKGMSYSEIKEMGKDEVFSLLGIPISYTREKCALLALQVLKKC